MPNFAPEDCHNPQLDAAPCALAFAQRQGDFASWRAELDATMRQLVGVMPTPVPLDLRVEWEKTHESFTERRLVFTAEAGADVPCHLLIPTTGKGPFPVVICLQGHSTGMHISLGRAQFPGDEETIAGGRDFALQAVREGYAALALEQRCFGERKDQRGGHAHNIGCTHASLVALMLGRTMIGERVWDVSRAIDALAAFPEIDGARIGCMGNSGGGTITYFAACLEPRITAAMPSCYVCTSKSSSGRIDHCPDNYLPGMLRYAEMGDWAGLIAPRPLVVVAGQEDNIFPIAGVQEAFATIQSIYRACGAEDNCRLVVGPEGHRFYPEQGWPVFGEMFGNVRTEIRR